MFLRYETQLTPLLLGTTTSSVERPTEESRWLAVLERVAERLLRSSLVDLGTGVIGLCCFSPLP